MADEETETPPVPEREGVPGSQVVGVAMNSAALALTALGGLWLWVAGGILTAAVGGVVWRQYRKRRAAQGSGRHGPGRAGARHGAARSHGLSPFRRGRSGRGTGGRTGTGRKAGGVLGARAAGTGRAGGAGTAGQKRRGRKATTGAGTPGAKASRRLPFGRGRSGTARSGGRSTQRGTGSKAGRAGAKAGGRRSGRAATGRGRASTRRPFRAPDPRRGDTKLLPGNGTPKPTLTKPPTARPDPRATARPSRPPAAARPPTPHPLRNTNSTVNPKGSLMSRLGRMWRQHSEEELAAATRYDPETMPDYLGDLQDLVTAFQNQASALGKMSAISQADLPVDKNVAEYIAQLQSLMYTIAEGANGTVSKFLAKHEADMARHKDPRPNEKKWNV